MKIEHARSQPKGVSTLMYVGDGPDGLGQIAIGKPVKIAIALGIAYLLYCVGTRGHR